MSVLNIIRYNSKDILIKAIKTQQATLRSNCLVSTLQKQIYEPLKLSSTFFRTSWTPIHSSSSHKQCLQSSLQSSLTSVRAMSSDHSHSKIWTIERFLSAGLIGLLPLSLAYPNPALDYALALALVVHVHWGVEAIAVDYLRPSVVGATLAKASVLGVYALSVITLGGLFYFNYNDVGLCQAMRMLWKL
ncbi:succinate dehydrogenase [ubiquinone] cytochrome b small subunit 2 [Parasteatoda tepidariorum]|uniref:succinate dehydrogenase [ubiquinone] cytochrome b small subunit 2 n=1 Tax=Parasteatoda tepidariorum TaxID=114398 RepID=UPI00077F9448|nr:succinate dehydrogenase [ubiquinone] cytochrome b small subunit, mitochondrial [Parasteatoda tepidariorum]